ncbi:MAG: hypothetical protein HZB59_04920 [Ignavibacteriales bacterium]|nr:hypothetical protein [Ignavibacteriales bacterium]
MINLIRIFALVVLLALTSCDLNYNSSPVTPIRRQPTEQLVWVAKFFSGGIQCDTSSHYTPPDTKILLNAARIPVIDALIEYCATCDACGCPTYAAKHFALIEKKYLGQADRLGFTPQPLPWLYVRTDRSTYKCSDNLFFTIDNPTNRNAYIAACNLQLTYWIEIFTNFRWSNFTEINIGPCRDDSDPFIQLSPNQHFNKQLALRTINNLESGVYRIKVEYRLENDYYSSNSYSNEFKLECGE